VIYYFVKSFCKKTENQEGKKVLLLQSTQNGTRLEQECRKHQYHKTHIALED
jgi:hypothetical protein